MDSVISPEKFIMPELGAQQMTKFKGVIFKRKMGFKLGPRNGKNNDFCSFTKLGNTGKSIFYANMKHFLLINWFLMGK